MIVGNSALDKGLFVGKPAAYELGQLLVGDLPDRPSQMPASVRQALGPGAVTFFMNNAGIGFQFAAVGARALELAESANVGCVVPDDLFLQTWHT